ncbi:lipoyl(octanoyl) transferase LipB [Candidatus Pelagibacter sp.]|nr:lipoyl(octanoyl) transferase LipB [Candidatus Pelagibacter sp.]
MNIDIKKSIKPVNYINAIDFLEKRLESIDKKKNNELIWILEHPSTFTAGKTYKNSEILDPKIKLTKSSRGGKITWHGPGQLVCYLVIDLKKRNKDIRKFIISVENAIIKTLNDYKIKSFSDRKNIGIWVNHQKKIKKVGAIGFRIRKWIVYHGFSINITNKLNQYKKIIPCGIKDRGVTNLKLIKKQNYSKIQEKIISNLINNLKI